MNQFKRLFFLGTTALMIGFGSPASAAPEKSASRCSDGVDNDGDGLIDCLDGGCNGKGTCEFGSEASCTDGVDNDADGVTDAADPDCAGSGGGGGGGSFTCPDMPTLNPNQPAPLGGTDIINFEAGSIIIPMDNCYQRADKPIDALVELAVDETYGASASMASVLCDTRGDLGQMEGYTVVQRLVSEENIPVHWSIKEGKTAWADQDFAVVGGGSSPVKRMSYTGAIDDPYSSLGIIRYAGAPLIISKEHAADAIAAIMSYGADYSDVSYHIAQTSFDAPIFKTLGEMPKMAVLRWSGANFTQDKTGFLDGSIGDIDMDPVRDRWWNYVTEAEVLSGDLVSDNYKLLWIPSFSIRKAAVGYSMNGTERALFAAFDDFARSGGSVVVQDEGAHAFEGFGSYDTSTGVFTEDWAQNSTIATDWAHSKGGLSYGFYASSYGNNSTTELTASDDYSDPASQWGGAAWTGIGGSKFDWTARCDAGYNDGVRRMVYTKNLGSGADQVEFASWKYHGNDTTRGRVFYLGGFNWRKNTHSGFRLQMNTIFVTASDYVGGAVEVSRSAPIVATTAGEELQYGGTYEAVFPPDPLPVYSYKATQAGFDFPGTLGHVRALNLSELANGENSFSSGAFDPDSTSYNPNLEVFDAADVIPTMSTNISGNGCTIGSGCRHIFTNDTDDIVTLVANNLENFKDKFGLALDANDDDKLALLSLIHAGRKTATGRTPALGGIDRSTMALIESSPLAGAPRPTIAYVGGLDGMLHAICAESVGVCSQKGEELWAFMPRTELSKVRTNTTRIDGSPKVADVFADFGTGKEYRTVLTFQTGNDNPAAAYGLDVTDPANPNLLWVHTTPGAGTNVAMAVIHIEGKGLVNATFIQTASGTDTAGVYLAAVDSATGELLWSHTHDYPAPRVSTNGEVPASGLPGGATVFASDGGDVADTVLVPSLWGAVWSLDAGTGNNNLVTGPLFQFETDFHPIGAPVSIYRDQTDQRLRAVIVSGGFTDSLSPTSTLWAPDSIKQYAISFPTDETTTVTDQDVKANPDLGIHVDLGAGQRAFSQAVIVGNEIFLTTDTSDINSSAFGSGGNTGRLYRVGIGSGSASFSSITSGAASVDVSKTSNAVVTGGANSVTKTDITGYDARGVGVETSAANKSKRALWLRAQ